MRLGPALGPWGRGPDPRHLQLAREAGRLGCHPVRTAESWGSDAFTPLTWIAAHTPAIRLGTAVARMAFRTPTATAMRALTLDHLSDGRMTLGLGLSGPRVVEGWYGRPFPKSALTATREYVDVIRQVLRREAPVRLDGRYHSHPCAGPDATDVGRPLKPIVHPLRPDLPVLLGAEGPKNSRRPCASPTAGCRCTDRRCVRSCPRRRWPRRRRVSVAPMAQARVCAEVAEGLEPVTAMLGSPSEGMGHAARNVHAGLMARLGYEAEARRVQELFLTGRRAEAIDAVPDAFADEISLVGPRERIAERLELWRRGPVTDLLVLSPDATTLRVPAELNGRTAG